VAATCAAEAAAAAADAPAAYGLANGKYIAAAVLLSSAERFVSGAPPYSEPAPVAAASAAAA